VCRLKLAARTRPQLQRGRARTQAKAADEITIIVTVTALRQVSWSAEAHSGPGRCDGAGPQLRTRLSWASRCSGAACLSGLNAV
jgi:hypothetical protein